MKYRKRTVLIRDAFYERLKKEAFFQRCEIKEIFDRILEKWIAENPEPSRPAAAGGLNKLKSDREIQEIRAAMKEARNHRERAADSLGISRMALNIKCRKYDLTFPAYRPERKKN